MSETSARGSEAAGAAPTALASRLHSASIHVLRRVRSVDPESGVTAARLSALSVVVHGGPLRLSRLAAAEQVTAPTMSRMVKAMEGEGLVARRGSPEDGRVVLVHATDRGRELLERARRRRVRVLAEALAGLERREREAVARGVEVLEHALQPSRPRAGRPAGRPQ